jgi:hypothetical protein
VSPFSSEKPVATTFPAESYRTTHIDAPGPVQVVSQEASGLVHVVAKHESQYEAGTRWS